MVKLLLSVLSTFLPIRDPYSKAEWHKPEVVSTGTDNNGRSFLILKAASYRDVTEFTDGFTPEGNVSEVHTALGKGLWKVHIEDWGSHE